MISLRKKENNTYVECVINLVQLLNLNANILEKKISFQQEFILSYNLELELQMYGLWNHLESRTCGLCLSSTFFLKRESYDVDMPNSNVDEVCLGFPL